jgi:hypothetical protein
MRRRPLQLALIVVAGLVAPAAAAQEARPWAGGLGVGGYVAIGGPAQSGLAATAALYPGAWAGRFGARFEARTAGDDEPFDSALFTAGLIYETAAARPRLSLALHGEAGAMAPDPRPALGGGVELQLWLLGPLALAADSSAHVLVDGVDSELVLAGVLSLRLAR